MSYSLQFIYVLSITITIYTTTTNSRKTNSTITHYYMLSEVSLFFFHSQIYLSLKLRKTCTRITVTEWSIRCNLFTVGIILNCIVFLQLSYRLQILSIDFRFTNDLFYSTIVVNRPLISIH